MNAIIKMEEAWQQIDFNNNVAEFLMITAEEEAATAIMKAARARGYTNANRLSPYNHQHKNMIINFIFAAVALLRRLPFPTPKFVVRKNDGRLFCYANVTLNGTEMTAVPDHPLNWFVTNDDGSTYLFSRELASAAEEAGHASIADYAKVQSNQRNLLLYAGDRGNYKITGDLRPAWHSRMNRIQLALMVYAMIDQGGRRPAFVQQAIDSLLDVMKKQSPGEQSRPRPNAKP